jgi:hypothetical protein
MNSLSPRSARSLLSRSNAALGMYTRRAPQRGGTSLGQDPHGDAPDRPQVLVMFSPR